MIKPRVVLHLTEDEIRSIVEALRLESSEYRRRWDGYPHRLAVPWLAEEEALAERIEATLRGRVGEG